jgi:hypothetical protein
MAELKTKPTDVSPTAFNQCDSGRETDMLLTVTPRTDASRHRHG